MIVFVKADGAVINVMPSQVYQGSNLSGSIYFVAPFSRRNAVTISFKLPNGINTLSYDMTGVSELEGITDKFGKEYSVWEWQNKNAEVTEYAGVCTVQFGIYLPGGQLLTTSRTGFEVQSGVMPELPPEPTQDVYEQIVRYLGLLDGRTKNVPDLVQSIQKVEGKNSFTFTKENGVTSAEISFGDLYAEPNPVTAASTIRIPKDSSGWQSGDGNYTFTVTADIHGQMIDGATANDLWVSFDETETDSFKGAYEDYTVNEAGDITITVTSPVDMTVRVWNGKGLVDTQARKDIAAETDRAEAEEEKLQTQIDELVNTGVDKIAREDIAAETQRATAAEEELQTQITAEELRAKSAEATLASDIEGLREDITNESHFRGMFDSIEALRAAYPTATSNDYAYIVGGNQWIYTDGAWTDSDVPSPNTAVPAGNMLPKMDGIANAGVSSNYSREDHVHAENNKKADLAGADFEGDIYAPTVTGEEVYGESGVYDNGSRVYSAHNTPPYPVKSVNSKTGIVALTKSDIGLSYVANERQWSNDNRPTALGYSSTSAVTRTGQTDTVTSYYRSADGTTWYRVWASGWKECGGTTAYDAGAEITAVKSISLPISFVSQNYTLVINFFEAVSSWAGPQSGHTLWTYNKRVNAFSVYTTYGTNGQFNGVARPFSWYACGY